MYYYSIKKLKSILPLFLIFGLILGIYLIFKPQPQKIAKTVSPISIPDILVSFTRNVIPKNYVITWYYYAEDASKQTFYFAADSPIKKKSQITFSYDNYSEPKDYPINTAYPDIILYKIKTLQDFTNSPAFTKEFNVDNYHFYRLDNSPFEDHAQSQCITVSPEGILSIMGDSYMWGNHKDCESYLKEVLTDDFAYTGEFNFEYGQKLFNNLDRRLTSCQRSYVSLSNRIPSITNDNLSVEFQCDGNLLHIEYSSKDNPGEKAVCCLKQEFVSENINRLTKIKNVNVCLNLQDKDNRSRWTNNDFKYAMEINLNNYNLSILSNSLDLPADKIIQAFESPDVGFVPEKTCKAIGI